MLASAPGRVNLLGDHVDYNSGLALPCAIGRRAWASGSAASDGRLTVLAMDFEQAFSVDLHQLGGGPQTVLGAPGWAFYPVGVAWSLIQEGLDLKGARCVIHSDVPPGSGLSSSAAVEVAMSHLLLAMAGMELDPLSIAKICQAAENDFAGVQSGLMDQWTACAAQDGMLLLLDFASLSSQPLTFPEGFSIVVASSGVERSLGESRYNVRVEECQQAAALLREADQRIGSLRDVGTDRLKWARNLLPAPLFQRVMHVVTEIERVRSGAEHLREGDLNKFGKLMDASHASLRDQFEVSIPELEIMIELARRDPNCLGARLTGAGFGGCTVQLLPEGDSEPFMKVLARDYRAKTGLEGEIWAWRPGPGASPLVWS